MSLPTLFVLLSDPQHVDALTRNGVLSQFSLIEANGQTHWLSQLEQADTDVALLDTRYFSANELTELAASHVVTDTDVILLSDGTPNPHIDQLMLSGSVFHFRHPLNHELLHDTLSDIARHFEQHQSGPPTAAVQASPLDQFGLLVGSSREMHTLYRTLRRVAKTESNVLIVGESGAGKELVANTLHLASARTQQPFIAINCGAISPELVDSELFGHEKGAFTGANKTHAGVFRQAEGGTLFLDEVTEMPLEHQVKLLRVLESGEYRPVGSQQSCRANVRVVAATNRDPQQAIEEGRFREDLYFRLAHFPIHVPPLRERGDDISGLAQHFLAHRNAEEQQSKAISPQAIDALATHDWPGNVRELKHCIERAYILADQQIESHHLVFDAPPLQSPSKLEAAIPAGVALEEIEKAAIFNTLQENQGNKTETASDLGISVKTLYNKLERYQAKS
ncbi:MULTISPECIES: sigma-54 interaction domain-containing protein [unclassified Vibrio]|uniref:sigma-54 interaction domain-containing protein n=1 Tax=unclassified Vibrio TaxID=2614977 RepID=UPI001361F385|nr:MULTISPECIES: sigma-54 dependent transcriptional regulator [unclassified Vibrio]NAW59023.1 AAA domain-containing protein [Vibrio sp. V36_P2S2PM302]NAX25720.1 AAA domain-containing protein [Vibrio sp. V38_P2S17PM301]NAX30111.1 AAA domain-containing protein [Vibrio sp. V37_P2S8PM304]